MSLMGTLGKVAMGVIVAKGVGKMMGGSSANSGSSGLGGLLGSLMGSGSNSSGGGIADLLGGLAGKSSGSGSSGGLGGILDSLSGGSNSGSGSKNNGLGDIFNSVLQGNEPEKVDDAREKEAEILLRAMLNAAKADGKIDKAEQAKLTEHLGDVSDEEAKFVRDELNLPLDVEGFIKSVPSGMEEKVYFMSLLAIDLDSKEEAQYLDKLSKGLNISHAMANQIHEKLGAPVLYS